MKHRYTFLAGIVVGIALGAFGTLVLTAPPSEEVERARLERERVAIQVMVGTLEAYSRTLTNRHAP
jgi:hypothetical protein